VVGSIDGKLKPSFACALYDRMQPIYTGEVQPTASSSISSTSKSCNRFSTACQRSGIDVAEYSSLNSSSASPTAGPPVAIPVFRQARSATVYRDQQEGGIAARDSKASASGCRSTR
jgi:hypothetical protein